jgi:hypothetical protein
MQNTPDTPYFVYFYVFTCEQCHCPYLDSRLVATVPHDQEIEHAPAEWTCANCNSRQSTALYRSAAYAKKLSVRSGKCSERHSVSNEFLG